MNWIKLGVRIYKNLFFRLWASIHDTHGNLHLSAETARRLTFPLSSGVGFIRPCTSDVARVGELVGGIYHENSYLNERLRCLRPTVLVDVGANIGLSTLSFLQRFPSLSTVVGIEAEHQNFGVLQKNYECWAQAYTGTSFEALNAVASCFGGNDVNVMASLAELTGANSASGTFRFEPSDDQMTGGKLSTVALQEVFDGFTEADIVMVKIDIEGGEEYLLAHETSWAQRVAFITLEIHDRFHESMLNSSENVLRLLLDNNFAIVPERDVLHCYNRNILF